jgi:hypothetical protein
MADRDRRLAACGEGVGTTARSGRLFFTTSERSSGGFTMDEPQTERRIKVREVTNIQASWTERERGEEGLFTLQLVLDNGADEYLLELDSDDVEPMMRLFKASDHATFDLERKVLMFGTLDVG